MKIGSLLCLFFVLSCNKGSSGSDDDQGKAANLLLNPKAANNSEVIKTPSSSSIEPEKVATPETEPAGTPGVGAASTPGATTGEGAASPAPETLTIPSVTSNSLTAISISWPVASKEGASSDALQYMVYASINDPTSTNPSVTTTSATTTSETDIAVSGDWQTGMTSYTISSLTENTSYTIKIAVRDPADGSIFFYTPLTVQTLNDSAPSTTETQAPATTSTTETLALEPTTSTTETLALEPTTSTTETLALEPTTSTTETQATAATSTTETQATATTSTTETQAAATTSTTETQAAATTSTTETQAAATTSTTETQSTATTSTTETQATATTSTTETQATATTSTTETQATATTSTTETQATATTSTTTTTTTPQPTAPTMTSKTLTYASPSALRETLSWQAATANDTNYQMLIYNVYYCQVGGATTCTTATMSKPSDITTNGTRATDIATAFPVGTAPSAVITLPNPYAIYIVNVIVTGNSGLQSAYTPTSFKPTSSTIVPGNSSKLTGTPSYNSIVLTWAAASRAGGSVSTLQYQVSATSSGSQPITSAWQSSTGYTMPSLLPNTTYAITLKVKDTVDNATASYQSISSSTPAFPLLGGGGTVTVTKSGTTLTASWVAATSQTSTSAATLIYTVKFLVSLGGGSTSGPQSGTQLNNFNSSVVGGTTVLSYSAGVTGFGSRYPYTTTVTVTDPLLPQYPVTYTVPATVIVP